MPKGNMISYHSDLDFDIAANDVAIIDESDAYIFKDPGVFQKLFKKALCICLTATCRESSNTGIERQVLESMGLKIFDQLLEDRSQEVKDPSFELMEYEDDEKMLAFINKETQKQAVLLYCTTEFKDFLLPRRENALYIDCSIDPQSLRNLDDKFGGEYKLLIADIP